MLRRKECHVLADGIKWMIFFRDSSSALFFISIDVDAGKCRTDEEGRKGSVL
jgi:hypothetical protein